MIPQWIKDWVASFPKWAQVIIALIILVSVIVAWFMGMIPYG